jgi:hypothetical protein
VSAARATPHHLVVVTSVLLAVATNLATNLLPDTRRVAPWLVWAIVAVLVLASMWSEWER